MPNLGEGGSQPVRRGERAGCALFRRGGGGGLLCCGLPLALALGEEDNMEEARQRDGGAAPARKGADEP